jgi:alpha-tubulin suppressor-like RCC1 family protein
MQRVSPGIAVGLSLLALAAGPSVPAEGATNVISIWGGARHCIILEADGTVWTWGVNLSGLLGDGTVSTFPPSDPFGMGSNDRHTPIQVHGPGNVGFLSSITAIMGGEPYNFALKSDGTVWSWGSNMSGSLGDGTYTDRYTPVEVSGLTSVTSLGGRGYHSLAIRSDGTVWTWGLNAWGELGDGTKTKRNVPVQVLVTPSQALTGALAVTGGYDFSLALMSDHTLMAWGGNPYGQLGDATYTERDNPVPVSSASGLTDVSQVSAGWEHAVAVKSDGTVWTWGQNGTGELGNGTTTMSNVPIQVSALNNVIAVSGGDCHTAALKADGTVWTWGCNDRGQLGDGTNVERHSPVQVSGLGNVIAIAARDYHNISLKADGSLWTWGWNINGQLGDNSTTDRNVPVQVFFSTSFYTLPPCRVIDTRALPDGPLAGPALPANGTRLLTLSAASCGIPASAHAVSLNVTVTQPAATGYLTLYPGKTGLPVVSTINFSAGQTRASNVVATMAFDGSGTINVTNGSAGPVELILDVNGYFQ